MFERLRGRFHCISLDRAGYRRSGAPDHFTTMEEQVEAIATVHRACTAEPGWVFGHSGGGNWALAYAVMHPDRVRGLVLMEPALHAVSRHRAVLPALPPS
jgi:pimeloyl-ACP methyl ester carboxylesterase